MSDYEGNALLILQRMIELISEKELNSMLSPEDADGSADEAEARVSWGGRDLYDITIKRV